MKATLMAIFLLNLSLNAHTYAASSEGFYAGGGAASIALKDTGEDLKWAAVEAVGGYKLNPFVGGEARLGFASDTPDLFYSSLYYRTESVNDIAKTYLLLGYTVGKFDGEDFSISIDGVSYGAGVGFAVTSSLYFNLEYRILMDGTGSEDGEDFDVKLKALSFNVDYRF